MPSDNVWNDFELQRKFENNVSKACRTTEKNENKDGKWCILTVFKTI